MRVGIFGTFDVENYGDLLFPIVAEHELKARLSNIEVIPHSYRPKSARRWPYDVVAIEDLSKQVPTLDGIIIGGGHLIRFDKDVAPGYGPLRCDLHHPTSYWLMPALTAAAAGLPVTWNAPSASSGTPVWAKPLLRFALDLSSYISVRDEATLSEIRATGFDGSCEIIPDTVFGLSNICTQARAGDLARPFLEQCGIHRNFIVLHAQGYAVPLAKALAEREDILANYDILLLPIGPILGDDVAPFLKILPTAKHLPDWPTPTVIANLIACSSGVIAASLHLTITALSYGIPVLRPDMPDAPKYRFLRSISSVSFASAHDVIAQDFVRALDQRQLGSFAADAIKTLSHHWDMTALALESGKRQPHHFISRMQALWNDLPIAADKMESAAASRIETLSARLNAAEAAYRLEKDHTNKQPNKTRAATDSELNRIEAELSTLAPTLSAINAALRSAEDRAPRREQIDEAKTAIDSKLTRIEAGLSEQSASVSALKADLAALRSTAGMATSASAGRQVAGAEARILQKLDDIYRNVRRRRRLKKFLKKLSSVGTILGSAAQTSRRRKSSQSHLAGKALYVHDIRDSSFFDVAYYLDQAGAAAKSDPHLHYVLHGEQLGFSPSPRFDPRFYREKYPDVAASKYNLLWHFIKYGEQEGRDPISAVAKLSMSAEHLDPAKRSILVLVHQASRTGAPILGWNIIRHLKSKYNVVAVVLHGGSLFDGFNDLADACIGPLGRLDQKDACELADKLEKVFSPHYAIANSVETRILVPAFSKEGIPVVSLVHEFSSYTFPTGTLQELLEWSGEIVFPAQIVADSSLHDYPKLRTMRWHVHAQGPSLVPLDKSSTGPMRDPYSSDERLRKRLRPVGMEEAFLVVGMGFIDSRKGVDLFLSTATSVVSKREGQKIRFVWIGDGLQKESSRADSDFYLKEQIKRAGLGEAFEMLEAVDDVEVIYDSADILFLSSRLDPLPNVSIDALLRGLPVVCFEHASGTAEILIKDSKTKEVVVGYADVAAAAKVISRLASDGRLYADISERVKTLAENAFDMPRYIEFIDDLAITAAARISRYPSEAELLVQPGNFEPTMYTGSNDQHSDKLTLVTQYLFASGKTDYRRIPPPGVHPRKALPGFHPFTYASRCPSYSFGDPLVDFIKSGRPTGVWMHDVIRLDGISKCQRSKLKIALHVHLHYTDNLGDLIAGLRANASACDLFITTTSEESAAKIAAAFGNVKNAAVRIDVIPNRGRDIKPYLDILDLYGAQYDLFGHIHGKRSVELGESFGDRWREFLWQNLIGPKYPAIDTIAAKFLTDLQLGLVFPEEPHIVGWEKNREIGEKLAGQMGITSPLPHSFDFPVGTMFWARPLAIAPLINLSRTSVDYPEEPLSSDGTVLHAIERILPIVTQHSGFKIATTYCSDITR